MTPVSRLIIGTIVQQCPKAICQQDTCLTHFLGFLSTAGNAKDYALQRGQRGENQDKKYTAVQSVMVSESMIPFAWEKEPMENYLTRPPTTKSPLNLIFIS